MIVSEIKMRIEQFILEGNTDEAINLLYNELKKHKLPYQKEVLIVIADNKETNRAIHTNIIDNEEAQRRKNKINTSLLSIIEEIEIEETGIILQQSKPVFFPKCGF